MRHRAAVAVGALVVATGLALVAVTGAWSGDAPGDAAGSATSDGQAASGATTVASSATPSASATGAAAASASPSTRGSRQGHSPAAASSSPTTAPSDGVDPSSPTTSAPGTAQPEVLASTDPGSTTLLPGLQQAPATLLPSPLPADGSRVGGLVRGYPARLAPVLPGSAITSSSVTSDDGVLTVTLVATTSRPVPGVLTFYADKLGRLGFVAHDAQAVPGSRAVAHRRGPSSVLVTVEPGSPTTYTLVGRWAPATG